LAVTDDPDGLVHDLAVRRAAAGAAAGRPDTGAERRGDIDEAVLPREHRHDAVFGDGLLVSGNVADRDPGRYGRDIDQVDPGGDRLQQPDARRGREVLLPDVAD